MARNQKEGLTQRRNVKAVVNVGQTCSLATLYAPGNLPADLAKAHAQLDKPFDAAYGYPGGKDDAARVAFLFELYRKLSMAA